MKWKYGTSNDGREQPWLGGSVVESVVVDSEIVDVVTTTIWRSENVIGRVCCRRSHLVESSGFLLYLRFSLFVQTGCYPVLFG